MGLDMKTALTEARKHIRAASEIINSALIETPVETPVLPTTYKAEEALVRLADGINIYGQKIADFETRKAKWQDYENGQLALPVDWRGVQHDTARFEYLSGFAVVWGVSSFAPPADFIPPPSYSVQDYLDNIKLSDTGGGPSGGPVVEAGTSSPPVVQTSGDYKSKVIPSDVAVTGSPASSPAVEGNVTPKAVNVPSGESTRAAYLSNRDANRDASAKDKKSRR